MSAPTSPSARTLRRGRVLRLGVKTSAVVTGFGEVHTWDIAAWKNGTPAWIGTLVHRDYDSGYALPYEVVKGGGHSWGLYPSFEDAEAGAIEYATAFLTAAKSGGPVDLTALEPETPMALSRSGDPAMLVALRNERTIAAARIRTLLAETSTEGDLRSRLAAYANTLAGER